MTTVSFEMPDEWAKAADKMNVPATEYTRRMVRAGRRQFGYDYASSKTGTKQHTLRINQKATDTDIVKEFVRRNLSTETGLDQNDLAELIADDIAIAADKLCDEGQAKYRHSEGGWIKVTDDG